MKTINSLRDLEQFGIVPLTGEADALGFRTLCDLTKDGAKLVAETFGLQFDYDKPLKTFVSNWNTGTKYNQHVGSVMLGRGAWREIGIIALLTQGNCHTVLETKDSLIGLFEGEHYARAEYECDYDKVDAPIVQTKPAQFKSADENDFQNWPTCYGEVQRVYSFGTNPHVGSRNVHAMSGRTK